MSLKILKKYKIRAKKALGQNFLVNDSIIKEIANTIEVTGKNIVEVGPGYGALTEKLLEQKPKSLNLVELDKDMTLILDDRIKNGDFVLEGIDFKINNIDVLKYEPDFQIGQTQRSAPTNNVGVNLCVHPEYNYSVIANIPYYITSPILRHFLYDIKNKPNTMVILMQKDVGDKIILGQTVGKKGKVKSSVLSLIVAKKAYVDEVIIVGKEDFTPAPKIESSVIFFEIHNKYDDIDDNIFLDLIKKGFREPRKKLIKNLINAGFHRSYIIHVFNEMGIDKLIRGEDLDIAIWCKLIRVINN